MAEYGVVRVLATVEADNERSVRLLERLAFRAADPRESAAHPLSPSERLYVR
jgi:RimJ/RimL family protein N-acetyltransferase